MFKAIADFFSSENFMPHGHCFLWQPNILWLHVLSDAGITAAYFSIPFVLIYFIHKRKDIPFQNVFWLFGVFILLCGTTHMLGIWVLWHPDYALEGVVKAMTAMASIATFFVMVKLLPQALQLPSPAQLAAVNRELQEANRKLELLYAQARESSQATQGLLASIVDSSDNPIISQSLDSIVMSWNHAAERLYGYKSEEIIGKPIGQVIPPDRWHEEEDIHQAICAGKSIEHFETLRIAKDGRHIDVSLTISPIRNADGKVIGSSKIVHDISERKQTEARLKATLEEVIVAKRVAEEEKAKAEQASKAKGEFLANMSHEIRTPLNTIIGTGELLAHSQLDGRQREFVDMLTTAGHMLLSLLNNILDFSKIESGAIDFARAPLAIKEVMKEVEQVMAEPAMANQVSLRIDCPDDLPAMLGDAVRVRQVLLNLVGNAVKFSGHGTVEMKVSAVRQEADRSVVRFSVKDTGPGIPPDKLEVIFEKFTQLDAFSTKKYAGTGLGLAICKGLVDRMGGRIGVESEPGKGALFWFELPFGKPGKNPDMALVSQQPPVPSSGHGRKLVSQFHGRVLLVEDYPPNRQMAKVMLEKLGCSVEVAQNGEEALERLTEAQYDLVFMDCQMPEMDGFQTTSEIRRREKDHHTVIIAMTAHVLSGDRERCIQAGMDGYVSKPIRSAELSEILGQYLAAA